MFVHSAQSTAALVDGLSSWQLLWLWQVFMCCGNEAGWWDWDGFVVQHVGSILVAIQPIPSGFPRYDGIAVDVGSWLRRCTVWGTVEVYETARVYGRDVRAKDAPGAARRRFTLGGE
ncbi:uncharacterized protein K452DRAFT_345422 [Aplosporella prunicola CBS 121167]|uniref:Uncharacterized protein n=1 Tax=Aplosporella prunicola CBS 121167 TaxID=1176127 RepID=A0A6A6BIM9_9PEZI|nr:uncharacterized protein K452DRAFT_345422 [Aplosporella prunicola CBS 121167]KAF2144002.1 hypothetical protein K452DRAFT_345422 [Aplosporella prunicola CBS 121167]